MVGKNSFSTIEPLVDPSSPTGFTEALVRLWDQPGSAARKGAYLDSRSRFRTWRLLAGSSLSLTYFNVSYSGRIDEETLTPNVLSQPNMAWLVNRSFTQAQLEDTCANGTFQGPAGSWRPLPPIGAIIDDNRLRNVALLKTNGIDLIGKYFIRWQPGAVSDFGLNGTYLFRYAQANTPDSPLLNIVSTQNGNPIDLRVRSSIAWTQRHFGISTFVNFEDSYRDTLKSSAQ